MVRMWARGGRVKHDSPDGRSVGLIVPCAGRELRGRVLSLKFLLWSGFLGGFQR